MDLLVILQVQNEGKYTLETKLKWLYLFSVLEHSGVRGGSRPLTRVILRYSRALLADQHLPAPSLFGFPSKMLLLPFLI